jgi:hypothetical protein
VIVVDAGDHADLVAGLVDVLDFLVDAADL